MTWHLEFSSKASTARCARFVRVCPRSQGTDTHHNFTKNTAQMETVLPSQRVDSHYEPVAGDVHVHRPGTVILVRVYVFVG